MNKREFSRAKMATTENLGGVDRYLTFINTDKPIYRGRERVYIRGVLLNAANHKPLVESAKVNINAAAAVEIKGPKGDIVASGSAAMQDSVWGFAWEVPEDQAGGEYTIRASYPGQGYAPAERKFDIRAYRAPRLTSQITFLRDGYGPGDTVSATLDVKRAEGGVPEGAKVTVIARVDSIEVKGETVHVDGKGLCCVSFDLPHQIPRGEGTLALVIEDGGVVETASKTIPILLQTVDLQIFPEGGDLIAGYCNRVYVQARQPNGKPADLVGSLMCEQLTGAVTSWRTEHEGRGRFEFTPSADCVYYLNISQPSGIKTVYPLPPIKQHGAVLRADKDVFEKGEPVTVQVGCTHEIFDVTVAKREVEVAVCKVDSSKQSDLRPGSLHTISFQLPQDVDGVLTVTVWGKNGTPLSERLFFREPANLLKVSIFPEKESYVPGDEVNLTVKATDTHGKPVCAVVGVTVTDNSVLEMVEKREQAPRLPVMVFLEAEVKDLAQAHVYLDAKNPKAPLATDLLLGTQGWRRFALMDLSSFIQEHGDQARRAVALKEEKFRGGNPWRAALDMLPNWGALGAMPPPVPMAQAAVAPELMAQVQRPVPGTLAPPAMPAAIGAPIPAHAPPPVRAAAPAPVALDMEMDVMQEPPGQPPFRAKAVVARRRLAADMNEISSLGSSLIMVRQFAHQVRPNRKPTDRVDFSETVYWNAAVKTDAGSGEATVTFALSDSVSTFRVFADAFAGDGSIGAAELGVEAVQPFYAEAKLPLEVTAGDQILLPINLINATTNKLVHSCVNVDLEGDFELAQLLQSSDEIGSLDRVRWIQPINVGVGNGLQDFVLRAKGGVYEDKVTRKLCVKPKGFPIEKSFGGMLEPGKTVTHTLTIPNDVTPASLSSNTAVYPTPLANLTEALQRMIQDPYGCFEQTSSTSYPLTMAQQYFLSHTGVDPKLVQTSQEKLDAGYKRLVGFWCPDKGYEWFGQNPGHEALTAFGLLHFDDMAKVKEVDQNMISTTRSWLLKQKDGSGGFTRQRRSLHTWIEDKDCSNAYILWALLEAGQPPAELKRELDSIKTAAETSQNYYVVALAANALHLAGDKVEATKLMDRLAGKQKPDGSIDGIKSSIVGSGGESLVVEGTSLATLAWLREPDYADRVEKSIKFLADSCKAGRYGSTQATVLALRAIVNYDKQRARPKAPGKVGVFVDGKSIGEWAAFDQHTQGAIKLPELSELLTPGEHKLQLCMEGGGPMPYSLAIRYNALTPPSAQECELDLSVKMVQDKVVEGAATEANVTVRNRSKEVVPTPVAIVGLPGGLEPRHDQLKELVKKGTIDAYEVLGREVVLYWRTLASEANVEFPLSLIAAIPGKYTGPASRAYLYYTDEHKQWIEGAQVEIVPK